MIQAGILTALRCSTKHKHSHVHLHLEFSLLDIYNLTLPCQDEALVDSIRLTDVLILYVVVKHYHQKLSQVQQIFESRR